MCREGGIQTVLIQLEHKIKSNVQLSEARSKRNSADKLEQLIASCFEKLQVLAERHGIVNKT